MTLYRKYRAQTFQDLLAQDHISQVLRAQVATKSYSHAYMLTGPRGCGKTSTARIFAKAISCLTDISGEPCGICKNCISVQDGRALDIIEMDAASNGGIEDIRDFKDKIEFAPIDLPKRVLIIDEVHMLSKSAFNALLKTLEEPPSHVILILATTDIHKVPITVLSRCQRFDFRLATDEELVLKLSKIAKAEGKDIDNESLKLVARLAQGSFRDSESILEKLFSNTGNGAITYDNSCKILGLVNEVVVLEYIQAIKKRDFLSAKKVIQELHVAGFSASQFVGQVISKIYETMQDISDIKLLDILHNSQNEMKYTKNDFLLLEIATYKLVYQDGDSHVSQEKLSRDASHVQANSSTQVQNIDYAELKRQIIEEIKSELPKANSTNTDQVLDSPGQDKSFVPTVLPSEAREAIQNKWLDIIDYSVRVNPNMAAYLSNAKIVSFQNNILTLFVKFKLHKDLLEKPKSREFLRDMIYKLVGVENIGLQVQYPGSAAQIVETAVEQSQQKVEESKVEDKPLTQADVIKDFL